MRVKFIALQLCKVIDMLQNKLNCITYKCVVAVKMENSCTKPKICAHQT